MLRAGENPHVTNLIQRNEAQPCVRNLIPRTRGEIENNKGNPGAAFPTVPHLHSGPSVYAIGLVGQEARKASA
jgi:hypothetical protein